MHHKSFYRVGLYSELYLPINVNKKTYFAMSVYLGFEVRNTAIGIKVFLG